MSMTAKASSIDPDEARRFADTAAEWWDADGPFRPLHKLNPARLDYIRHAIIGHFGRDGAPLKPLAGLRVVDLGSGGGLVTEPLARMGAGVTGIDVSDETIAVSSAHAGMVGLDIAYRNSTAEALAEEGRTYDIVLGLEVIEHVADPALFVKSARALMAEDGLFIFSTLNRSIRAFALGIVAAEYLLGWAPRGTHDWRKFMKPEEFRALLEDAGFHVRTMKGLSYDALEDAWRQSGDLSVNYIGHAIGEAGPPRRSHKY